MSSEINKIIDEIFLIFNGIYVLGSRLFFIFVFVDEVKYRFLRKDLWGGDYRFFLIIVLK